MFVLIKHNLEINWWCLKTWILASKNTFWCLLGCSIGDFGTIAFFQIFRIDFPSILILSLAIINGLITSILLETIILCKQMKISDAFKTALGMSLISMISMEVAMNSVDLFLVGEAKIVLWVVPLMLTAGFITPLPFNYWRLKVLGKACH